MTEQTGFPEPGPELDLGLPPARRPGPMTREQFESALRRAATYHADEGTSGWLLSEGQFTAILAAADEYRAGGLLSFAASLREMAGAVLPQISLNDRGASAALGALARTSPDSPGQVSGRLLLDLADAAERRAGSPGGAG